MKFDSGRLRRLLEERNLTPSGLQREFILRGVPISREAIYCWLNGDYTPSGQNLLTLAGILGCSPDYFFDHASSVASRRFRLRRVYWADGEPEAERQ